mmetsp:Transcript_34126/g.94362  ORF Transcript_34126/g.94362 Transcript_34126/m.94362 type:complete len:232 (+) Transcript_34126:824-1519(+)
MPRAPCCLGSVIGAQHDDDDIWLGVDGPLELGRVPVGHAGTAGQRRPALTEIQDRILWAKQALQLGGIAHLRRAGIQPCGDAVTHASDSCHICRQIAGIKRSAFSTRRHHWHCGRWQRLKGLRHVALPALCSQRSAQPWQRMPAPCQQRCAAAAAAPPACRDQPEEANAKRHVCKTKEATAVTPIGGWSCEGRHQWRRQKWVHVCCGIPPLLDLLGSRHCRTQCAWRPSGS